MSTIFKKTINLFTLVLIGNAVMGQAPLSVELPTGIYGIGQQPTTNLGLGPITSFGTQDSLPMFQDNKIPFNNLTPLTSQPTKVFMKFVSQQYTGLHYSNASTGLLFGATATTAYDPAFPAEVIAIPQPPAARPQQVEAFNLFNEIGTYTTPGSGTGSNPTGAPGGPSANMFTATGNIGAGTGITPIWDGSPAASNDGNGAFSLFTIAQLQYDGGNTIAGDPIVYPRNTAYNASQRYYYGDLVVSFNRFVRNPVIHFAGLGGAYRYLIPGGSSGNAADWRSTYFSTELDAQGVSLTRLSGNSFFQLSGANAISNGATIPSGGSTSDPGSAGSYPFDDFGAASGSVMVNGTVRTVTFKVWLRGAPSKPANASGADFAWSTARVNTSVFNREPLTGDLWWVSVSAEPVQLIPLPATGINLSASLTGSDVALSWKTLTELNSSRFDIERSTDGINFAKIGEKAAAGSSTSDVNYSYADAGMNVSVYYYRLKLVDLDGKVSYSNIAAVRKSSIKTIKVFPNPAVENLSVEFSNAKGSYTITLLNQAGQEVQNIKADISNTVQYVKINRNNVAAGMYYVRVKENNTGEVMSEKVIIK